MARERPPRPVQLFSDEYLERCRALSPTDIVRFLEDFRRLHAAPRGPDADRQTTSLHVPQSKSPYQ